MILHILKKDMRLLWPYAAASAAIWFALVASNITGEPTPDRSQLLQFLLPASRLGAILLTILAVQQDPVPGTRGDWLSRPIKRRDMLLAKLLFCVVTIVAPAFVAFLAQSLVNGHMLNDAAAAAGAKAVFVLLTIVPFVIIAALTESLAQALVCAFVVAVVSELSHGIAGAASNMALDRAGLGWMVSVIEMALVVASALIILPLQYVRRKTALARVLAVAGVVVGCAAFFLPWRVAFAVEHSLVPTPAGAEAVQIALDPALAKYRQSDDGEPSIYLPVRISSPKGDAILLADHLEYRLRDASGRVVALAAPTGWMHPNGDKMVDSLHFSDAPQSVYQKLTVRRGDYERLKTQSLHLEVNYSLTLFRPSRTATLGIGSPPVALQDFGTCSAVRDNILGEAGHVRCLMKVTGPTCVTASLDASLTSDASSCDAHNGPAFLRVEQVVGKPKVIADFRIDRAPQTNDRVTLTGYNVAGHFIRRLIVPSFKLSDWSTNIALSDAGRH